MRAVENNLRGTNSNGGTFRGDVWRRKAIAVVDPQPGIWDRKSDGVGIEFVGAETRKKKERKDQGGYPRRALLPVRPPGHRGGHWWRWGLAWGLMDGFGNNYQMQGNAAGHRPRTSLVTLPQGKEVLATPSCLSCALRKCFFLKYSDFLEMFGK